MKKNVLFLLCDACICGGTYVILEHASGLQKQGYNVTIALVYMKKEVFTLFKQPPLLWHPALTSLSFITIDEVSQQEFDIAIYTLWSTIFYLPRINASHHLYFVQSIESRFFPETEIYIRGLVDSTYRFGLPVITEATWIKNYLEKKYNASCALVRNGINKSLYHVDGEVISEKPHGSLRILVEGPINVSYKNVKRTVELCKQANVGEIWLLTSSQCDSFPDVDRVFSKIGIKDLPAIYRSCDVIVKLSYVEGMFGPPLEMFHCGGTAIVYDVTGHDEYIQHNINALVAKTDDEQSVITYLKKLNQDRSLLNRLKQGAIETAKKWVDWQTTSEAFGLAIEKHSEKAKTQNDLTALKNTAIQTAQQKIPLKIRMNGETIQTELTGNITNKIGHLVFLLPILSGECEFTIEFGKIFESFYLTKFYFHPTQPLINTPNYRVEWENILQDSKNQLSSQNQSGKCKLQTNISVQSQGTPSLFQLEIEIRPVTPVATVSA